MREYKIINGNKVDITTVMDSNVKYIPSDEEVNSAKKSVFDLLKKYYPDELKKGDGIDYCFGKVGAFWNAKGWILDAMKRHPNYNGNFQIVLDNQEILRERDIRSIEKFQYYIEKHMRDYGFYGSYMISMICQYLSKNDIQYLTEELYLKLADCAADMERSGYNFHLHKGEKITKLVGRIGRVVGLNKHSDIQTINMDGIEVTKDFGWNKHYADFCDAISPITVKETVIMSVHPVDYYTAANGDNWSTCYDIDKKRYGAYAGCHCNATQSHMMDKSSVIVYTLKDYNRDLDGNLPEIMPKRRCCIFYLGEDKIIQGRVYPDCRDKQLSSSEMLRHIVQKVVSELWDIPNYWLYSKGSYACHPVIEENKTYLIYPDWLYFNECNVSFAKRIDGYKNIKKITVGAETICPNCGATHKLENSLFCEECKVYEDEDEDEEYDDYDDDYEDDEEE